MLAVKIGFDTALMGPKSHIAQTVPSTHLRVVIFDGDDPASALLGVGHNRLSIQRLDLKQQTNDIVQMFPKTKVFILFSLRWMDPWPWRWFLRTTPDPWRRSWLAPESRRRQQPEPRNLEVHDSLAIPT